MRMGVAGGVAAGLASIAWAVRGRSSRIFGPSVWRGNPYRRAVALTFDDGPSESTPQVLEILEQFGARATFFQCGRAVERLPEVARAVIKAGHEIGNHSWSHARLYLRPEAFIEDEVGLAQEAIADATGVLPRLFRAPYGVRWFGLRPVLRRYGLLGVMWTVIASDWRLGAARISRRLLGAASNGAIFCLHDGRVLAAKPDIRSTLGALGTVLPELRDRGFEFTTVSELICQTT